MFFSFVQPFLVISVATKCFKSSTFSNISALLLSGSCQSMISSINMVLYALIYRSTFLDSVFSYLVMFPKSSRVSPTISRSSAKPRSRNILWLIDISPSVRYSSRTAFPNVMLNRIGKCTSPCLNHVPTMKGNDKI